MPSSSVRDPSSRRRVFPDLDVPARGSSRGGGGGGGTPTPMAATTKSSVDAKKRFRTVAHIAEEMHEIQQDVVAAVGRTYDELLSRTDGEARGALEETLDGNNRSRGGHVPCSIVHPDSGYRLLWDIVLMVLLLYVAIVIPARVCFDIKVQIGSVTFWYEAFIDVCFATDIFVNFRTGFIGPEGLLVVSPRAISRKYLRGWFAIDFLAVLPFSYLAILFGDGSHEKSVPGGSRQQLIKSLRLMRLAKLLRMNKIVPMVRRLDGEVVPEQPWQQCCSFPVFLCLSLRLTVRESVPCRLRALTCCCSAATKTTSQGCSPR
eukprot:COSAG05_NODE_2368_length_3166_cov_220.486677_3_plen_318_part_00